MADPIQPRDLNLSTWEHGQKKCHLISWLKWWASRKKNSFPWHFVLHIRGPIRRFKGSKKGAMEPKKCHCPFFSLVTCRALLKGRDVHGVEFYMQTPPALPPFHTSAPLGPRLPGCVVTDPEWTQAGWGQKQPDKVSESQSTPRSPQFFSRQRKISSPVSSFEIHKDKPSNCP